MKLLVSVRDPGEVEAALEGGAEIIDAKDPARGALGAVEPGILRRLLELIPGTVPFSAALGDPVDGLDAGTLIEALPLPRRAAPTYVKLGFAEAGSLDAAEATLRAAVDSAARHPAGPLVIAVAYADAGTRVAEPEAIALLAAHAGASGVLVDTVRKEGGSLLHAMSAERLGRWVAAARGLGLLTAVAGRLDWPDLPAVAGAGADVVGIRGVACDGGREGRVSAARVRRFRDALVRSLAEARPPAAKHQTPHPPLPAIGVAN